LINQSMRTSLADGWGGSMIATDLQDVLFGTPVPIRSKVNLGVLKADEVNILVHGHDPLVSEMVVRVAQDPEMIKLAKSKGARGINIAGICCTANEVLMRHGIPIAGSFTQQELAITTGAVEAMVVDVQCVMSSLQTVAQCYHTHIITTSPQAHIPGAVHIEFHQNNAKAVAEEIVKDAINNYPNRGKFVIPDKQMDVVAGFSHETINYMQGGTFRGSYRPLNDNIINGRIRGVAGVVGCSHPNAHPDSVHRVLVRELIANDVLVIQSGCAAIACAKDNLLVPEAAAKYAGKGLAEVCEAVGIPPVLHTGACVDNSRILIEAAEMVKEGGLGDDFSDLPVAGACPEWMSEKALAIGLYFVASGVYTLFGPNLQTSGSPALEKLLFEEIEELTGGKWDVESDPHKMAGKIIDHINSKRVALGIDKKKERVLYDMAMRRELEF
jgi:carbon-monoxide dehydrogenase catalytic subunit